MKPTFDWRKLLGGIGTAALVAAAFLWKGTQHTNDVARDPAARQRIWAPLRSCAIRFAPSLADTIPEQVDATLRIREVPQDSMRLIGRPTAPEGYYNGRNELWLTHQGAQIADIVEHGMAHHLAFNYAPLRWYTDSSKVGDPFARANDHKGPFFHACVHYGLE